MADVTTDTPGLATSPAAVAGSPCWQSIGLASSTTTSPRPYSLVVTTVLVTGGSGTLGRYVVGGLRAAGHRVRVLSRRPDAGTHQGDLNTGAGVAAAVEGADSVVHAASDTHRFGRRDVVQTRTLLELIPPETAHLLYVSIVGIDAIPYGYYRRKLRCEELVSASLVPSTILRATQFHELLAMVFGALERVPSRPSLPNLTSNRWPPGKWPTEWSS